ncbi:MAG: 30S ribosomal protein S13 [Elusimicrobiota bacterium]
MARIAGVNLNKNKKIKIALTYIYGIGNVTAMEVLKKAKVDPEKRTGDLTNDEANHLQKAIQDYKTGGELQREIREDIRRLKSIGSYRGSRHRRGLPVRGQRSRTNAKTRKGRGRPIKKKTKV